MCTLSDSESDLSINKSLFCDQVFTDDVFKRVVVVTYECKWIRIGSSIAALKRIQGEEIVLSSNSRISTGRRQCDAAVHATGQCH
jgi:hypothetical protein